MLGLQKLWGGLKALVSRTSLENPRYSLDDPALWEALGASKSEVGLTVNRTTALGLPAWYRVNSLVSGSIGKVPFHTYKRVSTEFGDGKQRAVDHPLYQRLRYEPNEEQTADVFIGQVTHHAFGGGNGYAYIDRQGMDFDGLWPLDPTKMLPARVKIGDNPRAPSRLQYIWTDGTTAVKFEPHEILHIKGFGYDGLTGYDVVHLLKEALGLALSQQKFYSIAIKNGASPRIILEIPTHAKPEQIKFLRETFDNIQSGLDNVHKTMILEGGMKANKIGFSPDDIKLVDSRKLSLVDIANIAGLPVHKVGGEGTRSYASLEQEELSCLSECYDFWLVRWEQECRKKLLTEKEKRKDSIVLEFMRESLVRMDAAAQAAYNRAALAGQPWETVNEVRARANKNPIEGGDIIKEPLNMGQGGINNNPDDPAADPVKPTGPNSGNGDPKKKREDEAIATALVADAQRRAAKRIATHAEKAAKQPRGFNRWLGGMADEQRKVIREILVPAYAARDALLDIVAMPTSQADEFLESLRSELDQVFQTTKLPELPERVAAWAASKEK